MFAFVDPEEARLWVGEYYDLMENECVPIGHAVNANIAMVTGFSCHEDEQETRPCGEDGFRFFGYALGHHYLFGSHKPGRNNVWANFEREAAKNERLAPAVKRAMTRKQKMPAPADAEIPELVALARQASEAGKSGDTNTGGGADNGSAEQEAPPPHPPGSGGSLSETEPVGLNQMLPCKWPGCRHGSGPGGVARDGRGGPCGGEQHPDRTPPVPEHRTDSGRGSRALSAGLSAGRLPVGVAGCARTPRPRCPTRIARGVTLSGEAEE